MKRIISLAALLYISNAAFCQSTADDHKSIDRGGENGVLMYLFQKTDVQGTQFLKDNWQKAKVITDLGYAFNDVPVKFDAFNNKFVFNRHDTTFELTPSAAVVYVADDNSGATQAVFKKGYAINPRINPNKFIQVLTEGKASLLKYVAKDIEEYNEYGNANKLQRYKDVEQYYFFESNRFTPVNLNKKNLESAIQAKWAQVEAFLKQNSLSGKDEKSWIAAIGYYNSL